MCVCRGKWKLGRDKGLYLGLMMGNLWRPPGEAFWYCTWAREWMCRCFLCVLWYFPLSHLKDTYLELQNTAAWNQRNGGNRYLTWGEKKGHQSWPCVYERGLGVWRTLNLPFEDANQRCGPSIPNYTYVHVYGRKMEIQFEQRWGEWITLAHI